MMMQAYRRRPPNGTSVGEHSMKQPALRTHYRQGTFAHTAQIQKPARCLPPSQNLT
eukprot:NODE_28221_length_485_cov_1.293296.p3 GENE.NODE_28221_length_485_cov_1.293296~~NODE_28221_length_485_cov_1.293296.p3  ORF type:complete len:56 (+),score=2.83 NODE_28221_length_485_cov_1.293296:186-353(+)